MIQCNYYKEVCQSKWRLGMKGIFEETPWEILIPAPIAECELQREKQTRQPNQKSFLGQKLKCSLH